MTKVYFHTQGCSANSADSEQMAGLLQEAQFEIVNTIEESDIVIVNSCTVKSPTESKFFTLLETIKKEHPYKIIIAAGCIPQTANKKLKEYPLIGTKQIHNVVQVVEEALNDNVLKMLSCDEIPPLNLPRVRRNPVIEILPINRGCLGACTFCLTKKARGNLVSYPISDIIKEARKALQEGVKEIWLTSQDTFCYGFDIDTSLPELCKKLIALPGEFKIRIGMGNPDHLKKIADEMVEIYKEEKVFKFLHLPLQSGHDEVLKNMARNYSVEEFFSLVEKFKQIPQLNIMTDLIAGFPGESEEHHWASMEALRKLNPDSCNISRFWCRPGTKAEQMDQLDSEVIKHRSKVLSEIFNNISKIKNESWMNWEGDIIIDEKGEDQWIGRNDSYKQVVVEGNYKLGDVVKVKIIKTGTFHLFGVDQSL